jgi:hypothetical protein
VIFINSIIRLIIYNHYDQKQFSDISFQLLEIDRNQFGEYEAQAKDAIIEIAKNIGRNDLICWKTCSS